MAALDHVYLLDTPCPLCLGQMRSVSQDSPVGNQARRLYACECGHSWDSWAEVEPDAKPFLVFAAHRTAGA